YETKYLARIFLCQSLNAFGAQIGFLNTGEQLSEILEWARKPFVAAGVTPPFQIGDIGIAVNAPVDEVKNLTCAEAARKMFRWSPDSITWFDYATTPPTFHCQPRAALPAMTVDLTQVRPVGLSVIPEYERVRSFVRLQYEISSEVAGVSYLGTQIDAWPDPLPATPEDSFHGIEQIIDLRGPKVDKITATVSVQAINTASDDWWLANLPAYRRAKDAGKITSFTVDQASVSVVATTLGELFVNLPNQLLPNSGNLCAWMDVQHQRQKAHAQVDIVFSDGTKLTKTISVPMTATDAVSKKYSQQTVRNYGDPMPQNLARQLFEANSFLHHKGSITFEQPEVGTVGGLGNTLNLAGQNPDWAAMGAVIQSSTERVNRGSTRLQFGWPEHLMAGDYIDLLRVTRSRSLESSLGARLGDNTTGLNVDVGSAQSEENAGTAENTAGGGSDIKQFRIKAQGGTSLKCVTWDGVNEGANYVYVAVPPKLRSTIASATIRGNLITYTYSNWPERVATINGVSETEVIVPCYLNDDVIYAGRPIGGTGVMTDPALGPADGIVGHPTTPPVAVLYQDLNVDGRAWAKKYGT
ncbi:MAG: hypothetical protein NTZ16_12435, partial [Verrucomicrobia bacterium]|nr:hypothetical protein [Verrucomicrobiota bacterium]